MRYCIVYRKYLIKSFHYYHYYYLRDNIERKQSKYAALIQDQVNHFKAVKFVNLSVSALGVLDQESSPFIGILKELNVDNNHQSM